MAVKIRLKRISAVKGRQHYRIVAITGTRSRDGRTLDEIGVYEPARSPAVFKVKQERLEYWLKNGAQMSDTVRSLVKRLKKGR